MCARAGLLSALIWRDAGKQKRKQPTNQTNTQHTNSAQGTLNYPLEQSENERKSQTKTQLLSTSCWCDRAVSLFKFFFSLINASLCVRCPCLLSLFLFVSPLVYPSTSLFVSLQRSTSIFTSPASLLPPTLFVCWVEAPTRSSLIV